MKFDTIQIQKNNYIYKVVSLYRVETKTDTIYIGEIILPGFIPNSRTLLLKEVLTIIGKNEGFSGFEVYPDCESIKIQQSSSGYSWQIREENRKNIVGKIMIDN
ncbi:hypothetical protein [Pontimicrobium sp. SW4]|uniref:Uncharacterized protein n=1 Tax=Pontimicrobium sp. SW4 TaxID=3153519 RepID=A0AAU7BQB0_9FLAO